MPGRAGGKTLESDFAAAMERLLPRALPERIAVAVSGGSDSTALLHLAAGWAKPRNVGVHAVTVDHGLRPDAAAEALAVRHQAERLEISHSILRWGGWDGRGNLQDAARRARHGLLQHWRGGIGHVLLGHTMDDQAETFLINLARGSGVAGLSGMAPRLHLTGPDPLTPASIDGPRPAGQAQGAFDLLRPLLGFRRPALRDWLGARDIAWSEDASNEDARFDRVRIRQALAAGNALGLNVEKLAATSDRLRRAREALDRRTAEAAREISRQDDGDVVFDRAALCDLDAETRLSLLAEALQWVAGAPYRPRAEALESVAAAAVAGRTGSLHGCLLIPRRGTLRVAREWRAVAGLRVAFAGETLWDRRWLITGPARSGSELRAIGEAGLARLGIRSGARPRAALAACPALFDGDEIIAVPGLVPGAFDRHLTTSWPDHAARSLPRGSGGGT